MANNVAHSSCLKRIASPDWLAASSCCKRYSLTSYGLEMKNLPSNHHSTRRTIGFMHQLLTGSDTSIPAVCYACRLWCPLTCHKWGMTELIFVNPGVKVNGQYYCDVLLSQQMLPVIKQVAKCCLFTKQYDAYGEIGHFLCSVISQGKVVALDRWGGKWNHLSMTHRLTTNYAKSYCNRTLIVKVVVENVVTCFLGHGVVYYMCEIVEVHTCYR